MNQKLRYGIVCTLFGQYDFSMTTDYMNIEYPLLINILTEYTIKYTKMISEGLIYGKEFTECEEQIKLIHSALRHKLNISSNANIQNSDSVQ